eukprot:34575-Prymnesium_polylepis.1
MHLFALHQRPRRPSPKFERHAAASERRPRAEGPEAVLVGQAQEPNGKGGGQGGEAACPPRRRRRLRPTSIE